MVVVELPFEESARFRLALPAFKPAMARAGIRSNTRRRMSLW